MRFDWQARPITDEVAKAELNAAKTPCRLRDPCTQKEVGTTKKPFVDTVPAHDVKVVVLESVDSPSVILLNAPTRIK